MKEFFNKHPIATFFIVDAIVSGIVKAVAIVRTGAVPGYVLVKNTQVLDVPDDEDEENEGS